MASMIDNNSANDDSNTTPQSHDHPSAASIADPHDAHAQSAQTQTQNSLFESLNAYPFASDIEFRNGLGVVLGRAPGASATDEEVAREDDLVLQAKCFYFTRKENISPPLNFATYKSWLKSLGGTPPIPVGNTSSGSSSTAIATASEAVSSLSSSSSMPTGNTSCNVNVPLERGPGPADSDSVQSEPTYPSSFARIVELITTGKPVPGIQQIPDTVLEGHQTPSTVAGRRKPWEEKDE